MAKIHAVDYSPVGGIDYQYVKKWFFISCTAPCPREFHVDHSADTLNDFPVRMGRNHTVAPSMPKLKICRVGDVNTAKMLAWMGVHYLGLHAIDSSQAAVVSEVVSLNSKLVTDYGFSGGVLVTKSTDLHWIERTLTSGLFRFVQIHLALADELMAQVRQLCDSLTVQLILMVDPSWAQASYAARAAQIADFCLFDQSRGGTGFELDEATLANLSMHKAFIAGGITAENIRTKLQRFHPYGFDVQSYVEERKFIKDFKRVRALLLALDAPPFFFDVPRKHKVVSISLSDSTTAHLTQQIQPLYDAIDAFHIDHADGTVSAKFARDSRPIAAKLAEVANEKPYDVHLFVGWENCQAVIDQYLSLNYRLRVAYKHVERCDDYTTVQLRQFMDHLRARSVKGGVAIQCGAFSTPVLRNLLQAINECDVEEISVVGPSANRTLAEYCATVRPTLQCIRDFKSSNGNAFSIGLDREVTLEKVRLLQDFNLDRIFVGKSVLAAPLPLEAIQAIRTAITYP